jgi:DnaJ like chaperone protein
MLWIAFIALLIANIVAWALLPSTVAPTGESILILPEFVFGLFICALAFGAMAAEQNERKRLGIGWCEPIFSRWIDVHFYFAGISEVMALGWALLSSTFVGKRSMLRRREMFLQSLFTMLGVVSNSDGRISSGEREFIRSKVAGRFDLSEQRLERAIESFQQGTTLGLNHAKLIDDVAKTFYRSPELLRVFLDLLTELSYSDGELTPNEQLILESVAKRFSMRLRLNRQPSPQKPPTAVHPAFATLGISDSADVAEIRGAYRRLAMQNHPDRLVQQGLPKELEAEANRRFVTIQDAHQQALKNRLCS